MGQANRAGKQRPTTGDSLEGYDYLRENQDDIILRANAQNVLDSYGHTWDLLAESVQNSVDAIEQQVEAEPSSPRNIEIVFNCKLREIEISDTGKGISTEELRRILAPGTSLKREKGATNVRGEKGVGISFIVFASNRFRIETCDGHKTTYLEVHNANNWVRGTEKQAPIFCNCRQEEPSTYAGSATFTRIYIEQIPTRDEMEEDLFTYTIERLTHVLRSKTAIGNTYTLFHLGDAPSDKLSSDVPFNLIVF